MEVLSRGTTSLRTINKLISLELHVDPDTSTPTSPAHSEVRRAGRAASAKAKHRIDELMRRGLV